MEKRIDKKDYAGYLSGVADGLNQGKQDTIAELEKIKAEINNIKDLDIVVLEDGSDGYDDFVKRDFIVQILDNHISELKGEQE